MNRTISKFVLLGGMLLVFSFAAHGQTDKPGTTEKVLGGAARTTYVVVGTTAKYGWKTTKFTAKHVVKPVATKAAPAVGKFAFKQSAAAVKLSFPVVKKAVITYLKF